MCSRDRSRWSGREALALGAAAALLLAASALFRGGVPQLCWHPRACVRVCVRRNVVANVCTSSEQLSCRRTSVRDSIRGWEVWLELLMFGLATVVYFLFTGSAVFGKTSKKGEAQDDSPRRGCPWKSGAMRQIVTRLRWRAVVGGSGRCGVRAVLG